MLAVDGEHSEAAKLLIEAGADVNLANNAGWADAWRVEAVLRAVRGGAGYWVIRGTEPELSCT